MKLLSSLSGLLLCLLLHSQSTFIQTTNLVGNSEQTDAMVSFSDGAVLTVNNQSAWPVGYISRFDSSGNRKWTKKFQYNAQTIYVHKIVKVGDHALGGYGTYLNNVVVIFKCDTSGLVYWCRENSYPIVLTDLIALPDSSVVACGSYSDLTGTYAYTGRFSNGGLPLSEVILPGCSMPFALAAVNDTSIVIGTKWHSSQNRDVIELVKLNLNLQVIHKAEIAKDTLKYPMGVGLISTGSNLLLVFAAREPSSGTWKYFSVFTDGDLNPLAVRQMNFPAAGLSEFDAQGRTMLLTYNAPAFECVIMDSLGSIINGIRYSNSPWSMNVHCASPFHSGGFLIGGDSEEPGPDDRSLYIKTDVNGDAGCLTTPVQFQSWSDSLTFSSQTDTCIVLSAFTFQGSLSTTDHFPEDAVFCHSTGLQDQTMVVNDVQLFPNPAMGIVNVLCGQEIQRISIFAATGEIVCTTDVGGLHEWELNLAGLNPGVYSVLIFMETGQLSRKLVITR